MVRQEGRQAVIVVQRDLLPEAIGIFSRDQRYAYQFIEQHKQEFSITVMCGVLGVSKSGFYAWRKRSTCHHKREDAHLKQEIRQVFERHQGRYGSPRIHRDLYAEGITCSRKRVARLMREEKLSALHKRRRIVTTRSDKTHPVALRLLNREFSAKAPNRKWVTDITSIPTTQRWLSLAVVLDLYSRMVVGWSMSNNYDERTGGTSARPGHCPPSRSGITASQQ